MIADVLLRPWIFTSLSIAACGGQVRPPADGGGRFDAQHLDASSPTDTASQTACPTRVRPGESCAPGTRPCLGDDQCNDCFCTASQWVCGSRVCADSGVCPTSRPQTGDPCAFSGQSCSYGAGCAGAECLCAGGRWTCDAFFCGDR